MLNTHITVSLYLSTGQITASETLFVYKTGTNYSEYAATTFEPVFELSEVSNATLQNATQICDGSEQCVFDYLLTGKMEVALASAAAAKEYTSIYISLFEGTFDYYANLRLSLNMRFPMNLLFKK